MCFDLDSRPPIAPIAGGALDSSELILDAVDGNRLRAFRARAAEANGAGVVILPDVRGLHPYYEELALRFAENGIDAVAIDYFGRSAGLGRRGDGFEYMPQIAQTSWAGLSADIRAGADHLLQHDEGRVTALFTLGFCFGGRLAYLSSTLKLDLAGTVGFYGIPVGPGRNDIPAPVDLVQEFGNPILGIFGGSDPAIPLEGIAAFEDALREAGVEHRIVIYDNAPHSFFDRKAADFAEESAKAWEETLTFLRGHVPDSVAR